MSLRDMNVYLGFWKLPVFRIRFDVDAVKADVISNLELTLGIGGNVRETRAFKSATKEFSSF